MNDFYIPQELLALNQWVPTYKDNPKRPKGGPAGATYSYQEVKTKYSDQGFGFCNRDEDAYFLIDFDKVIAKGVVHPSVIKFLQEYPTYTTISLSGKGLHAVYKAKEKDFKERIGKKVAFYKNDDGVGGEIRLSNCFTLFSTNHSHLPLYEGSTKEVAIIDYESLKDNFKFKTNKFKPPSEDFALPDSIKIRAIRTFLNILPLDQNSRIKEVYERLLGEPYSHYNYWLYVGMALHDCGMIKKRTDQFFMLYVDWSKKDTSSFVGTEDIKDHWISFKNKEKTITVRTLYALANRYRIQWPDVVVRKNGWTPEQGSVLNVKAVLDFYDISFLKDAYTANAFKVTGYKEVLKEHFYHKAFRQTIRESGEVRVPDHLLYDELLNSCALLCRSTELTGVRRHTVKEAVEEEISLSETYNPVKEKLDSYSPDFSKHTWKDVAKTLIMRDSYKKHTQYYHLMCRFWMIQFIKNLYYKGPYNRDAGILILQGGANIFKTTWVENMLPPPYNSFYIARNDQVLGRQGIDKDFKLMIKQKLIINLDEFEIYLSNASSVSQLKAFMTGELDTIRGLYERSPKTFKRKAVIGATSNSNTLPLPLSGIRRYWVLPVAKCDTTRLAELDLWQVYANLKAELLSYPVNRQHVLWNPMDNLRSFIETNARLFRMIGKLEDFLENCYEWDATYKDFIFELEPINIKQPYLKTTNEILIDLQANIKGFDLDAFPSLNIKLKKLLKIRCGEYTNTTLKGRTIKRPPGFIKEGRFYRIDRRLFKWWVPPIRAALTQDITDRLSNKFDNIEVQEDIKEMNRLQEKYGLPSI